MLMRKIKRYSIFFIIGAIGYVGIEIIWRGYTHWTMALAGGICFIIFSIVAEGFSESNIFTRAILCAIGITLVELVFGLVLNRLLGMGIWDYSDMPFNLLGQICPLFSLFWVGLALLFLPLARSINERV